MKTFIRVVEFWVPSADQTLLEFGGGVFGEAKFFAGVSRNLCFGKGEGLPGQAWEAGHAVLLKDLETSYFRRIRLARAAGLTCGIALPLFVDGQLTAVVVIYCGDDEDHAGAIELWRNTPDESVDMTLVDGYYGTTGDTFEFISRSTSFRRGTGLPGMVWERQAPLFLPDLGKGSGFLRADGARKVGINRGFAIPCPSRQGSNDVLAFLSALATPIARRVEAWAPDASGAQLVRQLGFEEASGRFDATAAISLGAQPSHPVVRAMQTGVPAVEEPMIAIPVAPAGRVTGVITVHLQPA